MGQGVTANTHEVSFESDENVVKTDSGNGFAALQIYQKPFNCILKISKLYGMYVVPQKALKY